MAIVLNGWRDDCKLERLPGRSARWPVKMRVPPPWW